MRPRFPTPRGLLVGFALSALVLVGCGSSSPNGGVASKTPAELLASAKAAADGASSVYVSGTIVSAGSPISLELELLAGKGGRGRVTQSGLSFEVVQAGGTIYIDGSAAFYRHVGGSAAAQLLEGRWLKGPAAAGEFAPIASLTDMSKLISSALASHGTLTSAGMTTVQGQKVLAINEVSGGTTVYIAASGKPYPIEVVKDGGKGGSIVFDRWNEPVTLVAPSNALDVTKLHSGR